MEERLIDDFTIEDCQKYLANNPDGKYSREVIDIMTRLLQASAQKKNDFVTEFNRFFATQRYEEAFAICLKYLQESDDKAVALEKADQVILKLKDRIQVSTSNPISYDWLIDQLVLKGYDEMKYDQSVLIWKMVRVKLATAGDSTLITSKCLINQFFRTMLALFVTIFACMTASMLIFGIGEDVMIPVGIVLGILIFVFGMARIRKIGRQPEKMLRVIANIIVENISNGRL